jgi:hypothetical protein
MTDQPRRLGWSVIGWIVPYRMAMADDDDAPPPRRRFTRCAACNEYNPVDATTCDNCGRSRR